MPTKLSLFSFFPLLPLLSLSATAQTTIPDGTTRYDANTPGAYVLSEGGTRSVTSGANEAIRIANAGTLGFALLRRRRVAR